jgi:penicillin-binding protein 1A
VITQQQQQPTAPESEDDRRHRIVRKMWKTFAIVMALVFFTFFLIYHGVIGNMPDIQTLRDPIDRYASVIYTADGQELGRFFRASDNRVYADYSDISGDVVDALIATEDVRFREHSGIDLRALLRAMTKTILLHQKNAGGGSTITQQLAKILYTDQSNHGIRMLNRIMQKPVEWMIAIKLERLYSKEEIIQMYLNQFDFLHNAVGIKSAAWVYFGKQPSELSITEAATLVGMVKNPAYFNPVRHNERARQRRNVVLEQMQKAGYITSAQLQQLQQEPLTLSYHKVDHKEGQAPYFRIELRRMLTAKKPDRSNYSKWNQQQFVDDSIAWATDPLFGWVEKNPKPDGSKYDIYTDGLKIYTTIDSRMQKYAEEAVVDHLSNYLQPAFNREKRGGSRSPYTSNRDELSDKQYQSLIDHAVKQTERYRVLHEGGMSDGQIRESFNKRTEMRVFTYNGFVDTVMTPMDSLRYMKSFLRAGFLAMDPRTGYVKAYVGGPNFEAFQYDMVSTGRRQIGSTIKPLLYTYAMEEGFTPCDMFLNVQPTIYDAAGRPWTPRNSGSARVGEMVDLRWALKNSNNWISARLMSQLSPYTFVRNLHNFGITNHLDPVVSICLGPCEVSLREMVTAYSAFANKGMRVDPLFVTAIADSNGNIISEFSTRTTEVISERAYNRILSILLDVVNSGTGNRLRRAPFNLTAQLGAKTGTTNYNSDAWFMAFSPEIVAATWIGGDERYIHFNSMEYGQGASAALPVFGKFMSKVYADPRLPYSQDALFDYSAANLCGGADYGPALDADPTDSSIEGMFD